MILSKMLEGLSYEVLQKNVDIEVTGLFYDSRKVTRGSVFVCIKGANSNGHDYIDKVCEAGAAAVIVTEDRGYGSYTDTAFIKVDDDREALAVLSAAWFDHPAGKLTTIGITGTKGKTTTCYMVYDILKRAGKKPGLIGTIETIIGDERTPAVNTTPESYVLQESFAKMAEAGLDCVVMEVSSQGLMQKRVGGFTFDIGVFTNIEPDHIGPNEHASFEDYMACKALIFRQCKLGLVNMDDRNAANVTKGHTCRLKTFGLSEDADFRAKDLNLHNDSSSLGISYTLVAGGEESKVRVNIPGRFTVYNSLTALAVVKELGVDMKSALEALEKTSVRGRVEPVRVSDRFSVMIDYAHNAMALESLLGTLKEYEPARLVCLFGCGGNRSRDRRFEMGEISSKLADLTIVTSDNPRFEEPMDIIADILVGVKKADGEYVTIPDRAEAIKYAIENAKDGDLIVIAGKGHEDYQEIKGVKHHMDDRELVADAVRELKAEGKTV
ncbi:MAG: UDP-N-acetylmuramoyl-L-alanyl-D-glutamate--2,6-diaminopimelate ligase [Lachnospiraceae bacterium]|nr:UDP-N-acetylmuramoyl-L-alanyl-D-glutamate--2,6-diaminopimelate ligase [Lachnospiraceae bacterium]